MLRPATVADAAAIAAINTANVHAAYRGILSDEALANDDAEARRARWHDVLADGATCLVAVEDDEIVGYANYGPTRCADRMGWGEVYALYVTPTRWRTGLGTVLLDGAVAALRERGFANVLLLTFAANARARQFYEATGWTCDGTEHVSPWGPPEARYVLSA